MATPTPIISVTGATFDTDHWYIEYAALGAALTLDATGSNAGGFAPNTYLWTEVDRPTGAPASGVNGSTSGVPSFTPDRSGTWLFFLKVTNNNAEASFASYVPVQRGVAPYSFDTPVAGAFVKVTVRTAVKLLRAPARYERDWFATSLWPLFAAVEAIANTLLSSVAAVAPYSVWVKSGAGPVTADGTIGRPFNATSAAANAFGGPAEQGIAALQAMDLSAEPRAGRTLHILGGAYNEDVDILLADTPWHIICHGQVVFSLANTFTYTAALLADTLARPSLHITNDHDGGIFAFQGDCEIGNADNTFALIWDSVQFRDVDISTAMAAGVTAYWEYVLVEDVSLANLVIMKAIDCHFGGILLASAIMRAKECLFDDDITLTSAAETGGQLGWSMCRFDPGNPSIFYAPAGAARFDDATAINFYQALWNFGGGAHAIGFTPGAHTKDFRAQVVAKASTPNLLITNIGATPTRYINAVAPLLDFSVAVGWEFEVSGLFAADVDAADSCHIELVAFDSAGGELVIASHTNPLTGAGEHPLELKAHLVVTAVANPALFTRRYTALSTPVLSIDDNSIDYLSGLNLSTTPVIRFDARVVPDGTVGASSEIYASISVKAIPPGATP